MTTRTLIAQIYWPSGQDFTDNSSRVLPGMEGTSVSAIVRNFLSVFVSLSLIFALCMVFYAGIHMVVSRGSADAKKESVHIIIWALVGVVIMLFAYSIVSVTLNLPFFSGSGILEPPG